LTGSHLEVVVEGRKLAYDAHFTSYKAVDRQRRHSCGSKWRYVTSDDRKWPRRDVIRLEVTWKWMLKAEKSCILYISLPTRLSSQ